MSVNEQMVQDIVQEVLAKMQIASDVSGNRGVFADMNEAIAAVKKSKKMRKFLHVWVWKKLAWEMLDIRF